MKSEGFSFRMSIEKIREFKNVPADQKLDWLEEANAFVSLAVPREMLARWERLKKLEKGEND